MSYPSSGSPYQEKAHVLVFLNALSAPIVLYSDMPGQLYDDLCQIMKRVDPASPKLIERPGSGPLKKVVFWDTALSGLALQQPMLQG
jgi:hypothetical protein